MFSRYLLLLPLLLSSTALAGKKCKCLPGDACFPDSKTLASFSKTLSQPLISNQRPIADACYTSSKAFNSNACSSLTAQQFNGAVLSSNPNTIQWKNHEELYVNGTIQGCPFDPAPGAVCYQGRVPVYTVNVTSVADIQNTIKFATQHNLHLVVKNNGHENLGRQFGIGALELFVAHLKAYEFVDNFVPEGAPKGTASEHALTIQPGVNWGEVYSYSSQHNVTVAGGIGAGGTVGAGAGWPLGGGHSILSPYYGLGVDNVLQMKVVLPNATYVTVNKYQHPDLYWGMRGGGGPNFGVVMSLTYRTHPNPPITGAFYAATAANDDSYFSLLELFNKNHNKLLDSGWAGFYPFEDRTLYLTFIAQGKPTPAAAINTYETFVNASAQIAGVDVTLNKLVSYVDFEDWYLNNFIHSQNGYGFNYTVGDQGGIRLTVSSWLIDRDTFDNKPTELAQAWMKIPSARPFMVGGGAVNAADPDSAAVTPAWRTCVSDMTLGNGWAANATLDEINAVKKSVFDQIQPLRELVPVPKGGQYINEADALEVDWQGAYWGKHYPRLRALKQQVDPHDLFIVYKGVNSEGWDEESICKTT